MTQTTRYAHLLAPGRIGNLELRNRVVMPAMDMNLCEDGSLTDGEIDHYTARARGGAGLVITGTGAVLWPEGAASLHQPAFSDDRHIDGMRRLADSVHDVGGRVAMQLCHHGKVSTVDMAAGRDVLVPSVPVPPMDLSTLGECTPDELMGLATASGGKVPTYREATDEDLARVVEAFAAAARRVQVAGIDAIEIHAAHGYLLSTFLSPGYNRRTDAWGGDAEGRSRLTCEVVRAVRAVIGPGYPLLVRINGIEFGPDGGTTPDDAAAVARHIAAAGADAIHVSANAHDPFVRFTDGPLPDRVAAYRSAAAAVRTAVDVPVIAVGRLLPDAAETMLAEGACDFVSMGRQLLADPDLVEHLTIGGTGAVRPCINCYVCVEKNFVDATPCCAVNARLGRGEMAPLAPVLTPRRVVVVGGGPAGLEAARVAATRGHDVVLVEASAHLGGTMRFSALTTPDNAPFVDWLSARVVDAGVDVRLGAPATASSIGALEPDVVVVATGARRTLGPLADLLGSAATGGTSPDDLPRVHTGDDLRAMLGGDVNRAPEITANCDGAALPVSRRRRFGWPARTAIAVGRRLGLLGSADLVRMLSRRWMPLGSAVVVVGGGLVGLEVATFLAERGRRVKIIEAGSQLGRPMALPRRWREVRHAQALGVTCLRDATVTAIRPGGLDVTTSGSTTFVPADDVIVAEGVEAGAAAGVGLAAELAAVGLDVRVIGDAGGIGYIEGAVRTGFDLGAGL